MGETLFSFKETSWFTKHVGEILSDAEYSKLQWRLIEFPDAGDVIKGAEESESCVSPQKVKERAAEPE